MKRRWFIVLGTLLLILAAGGFFLLTQYFGQGRRYVPLILCMGDSLTESSYGSYPRQLRQLLFQQHLAARVVVSARPGNNSSEYRRYFTESSRLRRLRPDMVLLMLGTNDVRLDADHTELADFENNMEVIVDDLLARQTVYGQKPLIFLATILPIYTPDLDVFSGDSQRRIREEINPAIRRLAQRKQLILVELEYLFERERSLLPGVHPVPAGYRRLSEEFYHALQPYLGQ